MKRPRAHSHPCNIKKYGHYPVYRWIAKLLSQGLNFEVQVLKWSSKEELGSDEIGFISENKAKGIRLLNVTGGGDGGMLGVRHSEESNRKRSKSLTGLKRTPEQRETIRQAMLGRKVSEEHKEKLRQANLGKRYSDETKRKHSLSRRGRIASPKARENYFKAKSLIKKPKLRSGGGGHRPGTPKAKPIIDDLGNRFASVGEAAKHYGVNRHLIRRVAQGKKYSARGRIFKYIEEVAND